MATQLASSAAVLAVLVLGMMKISVGMTRHRPVGFLVILCAMTAVIGLALLVVRPRRSRYGDRELDRLRRENAALRTATGSRADELTGADLALALGLFGTAVLAEGPLADLRTAVLAAARVVRRLWWWLRGRRVWRRVWRRVRRVRGLTLMGGFAGVTLGLGIGWRPELALPIDRYEGLGFVEVIAEGFDTPGPIPAPLERLRAGAWRSCRTGSRSRSAGPAGPTQHLAALCPPWGHSALGSDRVSS